MEILKQIFKIQIFATDIDRQAIEEARKGVYPPIISIDVSPERLERFFLKDPDGNYSIQQSIREMIFFPSKILSKTRHSRNLTCSVVATC